MRLTAPSILVVDDDADIFTAVRRTLRRNDYRLVYAESAEEGLNALEREHFQLVISDNRMRGMTGAEFLELVRIRFPGVVRIMVTSDARAPSLTSSQQSGAIFRLLPKPWDPSVFEKAVRFALQYWRELAVEAELFTADAT